jgi:hypothetical protein
MRSDENLGPCSSERPVVGGRRARYRQGGLNYVDQLGMTAMNLVNMCRAGLLPLLLAGAAGCSDMDPAEDTYRSVYMLGAGGDGPSGNAGSGGSGGTGDEPAPPLNEEDWGCLSTGITMPMMAPSRITYQVAIVDFDSQTISPTQVPGLDVKVCTVATCDQVLPACDTTLGDPAPTQQCAIVAQGPAPFLYLINLPYRLENGGLRLTAANYVQMNYIFGGPMVGTPEGSTTVVGLTIPLLTEEVRRRVYRQVGLSTVDPNRGTLAVRTLTCARQPNPPLPMPRPPEGQRARDILVTAEQAAEAPAVSWSLSNGNQFTDDRLVTDARGVAGILNVEPSAIIVKAVLPNGDEYGETTLPVVENVVTLAELRPGLERWGQ